MVNCETYFKNSHELYSKMLGEESSQHRQLTAWNCEQYVEENVRTNEALVENSGKEGRTPNETGA